MKQQYRIQLASEQVDETAARDIYFLSDSPCSMLLNFMLSLRHIRVCTNGINFRRAFYFSLKPTVCRSVAIRSVRRAMKYLCHASRYF